MLALIPMPAANQNPYAPPVATVSDVPAPDTRRLHSFVAIAIAAFFGGAIAAGYLVFLNFNLIGQSKRANRSLAAFTIGGLVALYVAWHTPPDIISFQITVGIPQFVVVCLAAWYLQGALLNSHRSFGGVFRSKWFAFGIAILCNASIKVLFYALHSFLEFASPG